MVVKTKKSKKIMDFLKENMLINLNTIGIIENEPEVEIFVDNEESPKGVFVKKAYFNYLYSEEDSFIDEVMDTFFQDGFYGFAGIDAAIAEKIQRKFHTAWNNPCTLYYLPKENLDLSLIKNPVQTIELMDAEIIDKFYEFRHPESIEVIRKDIERRPSSAVYIDGEPVCWVLVHDDNSMGIMYTREEYRRKGYAVDVTMDLAAKIYEKGQIPYLQIIHRNNMSPGLAKKCNFVKCGEVSWFGIVSGLPEEIRQLNRKKREEFLQNVKGLDMYMADLTNSDDEEMYYWLCNKKDTIGETVANFHLEQVQSKEMMDTWCEVVCSGYDILEQNKQEAKNTLLALYNNSAFNFYIGYLNGMPATSSALLKDDEGVFGMYFVSTVHQYRHRGIATLTVNETMNFARNNGEELMVIQSPTKYTNLFRKLGFVSNFNKQL